MALGPDRRPDGGSAVVDFALVSALVTIVSLASLQVGLTLYVRNVLVACASEGARLGARADASAPDGAARARALITASVSERYARHVTAQEDTVGGVRVVVVRVEAPMPVIGLLGTDDSLRVVGRAFEENQ